MLCPFLTNISTCKPLKTKASPTETIARYPLGSQRILHTLKRLLQKENKNKTYKGTRGRALVVKDWYNYDVQS